MPNPSKILVSSVPYPYAPLCGFGLGGDGAAAESNGLYSSCLLLATSSSHLSSLRDYKSWRESFRPRALVRMGFLAIAMNFLPVAGEGIVRINAVKANLDQSLQSGLITAQQHQQMHQQMIQNVINEATSNVKGAVSVRECFISFARSLVSVLVQRAVEHCIIDRCYGTGWHKTSTKFIKNVPASSGRKIARGMGRATLVRKVFVTAVKAEFIRMFCLWFTDSLELLWKASKSKSKSKIREEQEGQWGGTLKKIRENGFRISCQLGMSAAFAGVAAGLTKSEFAVGAGLNIGETLCGLDLFNMFQWFQ